MNRCLFMFIFFCAISWNALGEDIILKWEDNKTVSIPMKYAKLSGTIHKTGIENLTTIVPFEQCKMIFEQIAPAIETNSLNVRQIVSLNNYAFNTKLIDSIVALDFPSSKNIKLTPNKLVNLIYPFIIEDFLKLGHGFEKLSNTIDVEHYPISIFKIKEIPDLETETIHNLCILYERFFNAAEIVKSFDLKYLNEKAARETKAINDNAVIYAQIRNALYVILLPRVLKEATQLIDTDINELNKNSSKNGYHIKMYLDIIETSLKNLKMLARIKNHLKEVYQKLEAIKYKLL